MQKIKNYIQTPEFKEKILPEVKRLSAVVFFTFIYGIGLVWFLEQSAVPMYTGGIPGVAQVFRDLLVKNGGLNESNSDLFMMLFIIITNLPILILGWFGVSKRFTIYSLISVIIQATVIGFIPVINFGLNNESHALLAAILGGLLIGVGVGGALKYGTSTGGFDIIAQYWSIKKGSSVGFISMVLNVLIAFAGALITGDSTITAIGGGLVFAYTIVRLIVTTIATDRVHTAYQYLSMEIITESPLDIIEQILYKLGRGVTLSKVYGAYSNNEKTKIMVVISSYELQSMLDIIKSVDEKAFVISRPVKNVHGNFAKKRIA